MLLSRAQAIRECNLLGLVGTSAVYWECGRYRLKQRKVRCPSAANSTLRGGTWIAPWLSWVVVKVSDFFVGTTECFGMITAIFPPGRELGSECNE